MNGTRSVGLMGPDMGLDRDIDLYISVQMMQGIFVCSLGSNSYPTTMDILNVFQVHYS